MGCLTRRLVLASVCLLVFGSATKLHAQAVTLNPASAGFGNLAVGTTSTKPVRLLSVSVSPSSATIGVGQEKQFTSFNSDWGYGGGWYRGGWYGGAGGMSTTTGQTSTIYIGQLALDMYDSANKDLAWRGVASKTATEAVILVLGTLGLLFVGLMAVAILVFGVACRDDSRKSGSTGFTRQYHRDPPATGTTAHDSIGIGGRGPMPRAPH